MTQSFGEAELLARSRNVGKIRVKNVYHSISIYPRLVLSIGISLNEQPQAEFSEGRPIANFEVRDCSGELRLEESSQVVGLLHLVGSRGYRRSQPYRGV